ncbi:MAG TPA: autotransporter-associated beta strand repeat-containing protein [Candidatus Paceibacterota bacterium]|nr:autotransporter-associated beta strand repeat-containing protein [Candidatus Paceibacterota bacterium]
MKRIFVIKSVGLVAAVLTLALTSLAQTVTNPCPNRVISWNLDDWSTVNPTDLAGLAPATNWVDTWLNDATTSLPENTGATTTLNLSRGSFNTWHLQGSHPGLDADGTANRELLNGYMNSGPAGWGPWTTNTWVTLTNIPYARYDVIVYFNADANGRHCAIDNGTTSYYFSTVGAASISGPTALFLPTTETNSAVFPVANFAVFSGMTTNYATFKTSPKSGNDQWMGIAGFQVIESSNVYVLYGPSPATKVVSVGQPASFSVMAGGLDLTYQWRHAGTNIPNATNATYSIASAAAGHDGNYDVVLANSFSSMTSVVATLTFYAPKTDTWAGTGSTWDFASFNWTVNGGASTTNYADTDQVRFDPLGIAQPAVTVDGTFSPSSIVISNASYTFNTFTSGKIAGAGSLRLMNNATLFLQMPDNRTGTTVIDSGSVLEENDNGVLASGPITNNGALIFNTTGVSGGIGSGYPIYGGGSITNVSSGGVVGLSADIRASSVVQSGAGALLVQGHNNLLANILVTDGAFQARDDGALGGASVTITGGELALYFNFDYVGASVNLAGGTLHGGISGSQSFAGPVTLTADAAISVDGGSSLTLSNAAGISGGSFNLTKNGGGALVLNGTANSWSSLTLNAGTVAFNSSANETLSTPVLGTGNIEQRGAGTLTLSGDNSGMTGTLIASGGTLVVNTASSALSAVATNTGALGGNGTIAGPVGIEVGATLAPGTASIGTLTLNSDLTIGGNVLVKVNKSLTQSNDFVSVTGVLSNTNNGTVTVNNLGPALQVGDSFKLFSQAVTGGEALSVTGAGVVWANNLATDGTIQVLSTAVPKPVINSVVLSSGSLVFSGTNGTPNGTFTVLSTTNLALPLSSWSTETTGNFNGSGAFSVTNPVSSSVPQKFYLLKL